MYRLIRAFLFSLSPETAHAFTVKCLSLLNWIPFAGALLRAVYNVRDKKGVLSREVFGITFKNPVGLAAGLDKNGDHYNDMANFGFSFIEIGSLTPLAQPGNPKPRLFRLVEDKALINRMGINNKGVKYAVGKLQKNKKKVIVGGNISKAAGTPNEEAWKDYERSFSLLYDYVDYFVVNVSCPNVKDLTKLQDTGHLADIIDRLLALRRYYDDYRPILLKISPDISRELIDDIIRLSLTSGIDGIVATNTTNSRDGLLTDAEKVNACGNGGLSGSPLFDKSLEMVRYVHEKSCGLLPIIGVGGIMTPRQAKMMLDAGASLIQIYTGFIYNGPAFVRKILLYLKKCGTGNE